MHPDNVHVGGIYTPAFRVRGGDLVFCSGIVGVDEEGKTVGVGDAAAQTHQALINLQKVLEAAGGTCDDVVSLRVFSTDMNNRKAINDMRLNFFSEPLPASTHVEVSRLVKEEWLVEIEALAVMELTE